MREIPRRVNLRSEEAYEFAHEAHQGQNRATGEPYIVHPIDAAMTVADLNLDGAAIAAALLHDVVEDCGVSNEDISKRFGADVARLVEGVTKLSRLNLLRPEDAAWDDGVQVQPLLDVLPQSTLRQGMVEQPVDLSADLMA